MIAFVQANIWPIVTLGLNGQLISTTLWGCIVMMWRDHAQVVAVLAALTLFFFPIGKMLLLGWVLLYARRGQRAPGFRPAMVMLYRIGPWTMSEVFVLGALVAIVKAHMYFDVIPNPGIFAYGVLMLLISGNPLYAAGLGIAAFAAARLVVRHDPNAFRLMMLWSGTKARCRNRAFWGGSSYSPLPTAGARRQGFGR